MPKIQWLVPLRWVVLVALLMTAASAEVATLRPSKDTSIYRESGNLSNGSGARLFAGTTNFSNARRALIAFDVASAVPAGALIIRAQLSLNLSRTGDSELQTGQLRRLQADWGEGASDAPGNEGRGTQAEEGDATWTHRFFPDVLWAVPGGEFASSVSASSPVNGPGRYFWGSTPAMVQDVQSWLDQPDANYGWALLINENSERTAKRFDSRENPNPETHPLLEIEFIPAGAPRADLTAELTDSADSVFADGTLSFTASFSNLGSDDSGATLFSLALPPSFAILQTEAISSPSTPECLVETRPEATEYRCSVDSFPAGGSLRMQVLTRAEAQGVFESQARAQGALADPDPSNNVAVEPIEVLAFGGEEFYFAQFGSGIAGETQFRTALILTNTSDAAQALIEVYDSQGMPLVTQFADFEPSHRFEVPLEKGSSRLLSTPGTGPLQVGYVRVRTGPGVGGTAVFSQRLADSGVALSEAGVAQSRPLPGFTVFIDTLGNRNTGLALVNPGAEEAAITLRLYDQEFRLLGESSLQLAGRAHLPRFVTELLPSLAGVDEMVGSLAVSSDQPLAAITLRQTDDPNLAFPDEVPALTTFPVIPGLAPQRAGDAISASQSTKQLLSESH